MEYLKYSLLNLRAFDLSRRASQKVQISKKPTISVVKISVNSRCNKFNQKEIYKIQNNLHKPKVVCVIHEIYVASDFRAYR